MKRAAVIVTDADSLFVQHAWAGHVVRATRAEPSEQLLADLRRVCQLALGTAIDRADDAAVARVRALLPEEDGDE